MEDTSEIESSSIDVLSLCNDQALLALNGAELEAKLHILRLEESLHLLFLCCILDNGCLENQLELPLVDSGFKAKLVSFPVKNFEEAIGVQPGEEHGFDAARRGLQVDGVNGALNFEYLGELFFVNAVSCASVLSLASTGVSNRGCSLLLLSNNQYGSAIIHLSYGFFSGAGFLLVPWVGQDLSNRQTLLRDISHHPYEQVSELSRKVFLALR